MKVTFNPPPEKTFTFVVELTEPEAHDFIFQWRDSSNPVTKELIRLLKERNNGQGI